ncbi:hypothetical protein JZU54_03175, partial [bacterium]|nr:hypothetical protein [bacterium]
MGLGEARPADHLRLAIAGDFFPISRLMKIPHELLECGAETAIVLGSGLGPFAESLPHDYAVAYSEIE